MEVLCAVAKGSDTFWTYACGTTIVTYVVSELYQQACNCWLIPI